VAQKLGRRLAVARLSDVTHAAEDAEGDDARVGGGTRCGIGEGDLDVVAYRIALDLATGRAGPVVLDLRGLVNPLASARAAGERWEKAAFTA
jgi:hypothetical protein